MFEGRLVRLRALEPGDAQWLRGAMNNPAVRKHLAARYPMSLATETAWIDAHATPGYDAAHYAIETIADGALIGACGFHQVSREDRCGEIGIAVGDPAYWGRGYGTDAVRTLCQIGFAEMNLHRVELWCFADNERGLRSYAKVGFVEEARGRDMIWKGGRWHDEVLMGLLAGELREEA